MNPLFPPQARRRKLRNKGTDSTTRLTLNGPVSIRLRRWRSPAGSERPGAPAIGVPLGEPSAGFREMACDLAVDAAGSFDRQAKLMKKWSLGSVGEEKLRQTVEAEGRRVQEAQQKKRFPLDWKVPKATAASQKPLTMCLGVDGTMTRQITEEEKRKRRQKTAGKRSGLAKAGKKLRPLRPRKKGADNPWKEVKIVGVYDREHEHRHWASTVLNHVMAAALILRVAGRVGLTPRHAAVAVVDGASWIQRRLRETLPHLQAIILDFYHLSEHVHHAMHMTFGEGSSQAQQWAEQLLAAIRYEGYAAFDTLLQTCLAEHGRTEKAGEALAQLRHYVDQRRDMVDYPTFEAEGWPIGSGPTESMAGVLTSRIKGRGRRWDADNIDAMMALQALEVNDESQAYWRPPPAPQRIAA